MVEVKDATHLLDVLGFFCPVPVAEAKAGLVKHERRLCSSSASKRS